MMRVSCKMLSQMGLCFPVLFTLVLFYTDTVRGDIVVNCGPGAVVGQPYNVECTNITLPVTNGINVFLEGESNSIIFCFPSKNCISQNNSLYSVVSPHNESLYFTILSVTTDDIGKKVFGVDAAALDASKPQPNCTITPPPTTDGLSAGEIVGIVLGVLGGVAGICIGIVFVLRKNKYTIKN